MERARNEFFLLRYSIKIVIYRVELTYGNLFYTCYLFTPKLFHNCKWGISICLKSKTNNGNALAMRKDFRHENVSGCYISKKNFIAPFYGWGSTASMLQSH